MLCGPVLDGASAKSDLSRLPSQAFCDQPSEDMPVVRKSGLDVADLLTQASWP